MQINVTQTDSQLRENPYNTAIGQEVVSVQENFWARLWREGRTKQYLIRATPIASLNTDVYSLNITSPLDAIFYPSKIIMSASVDAELIAQIQPGTQDTGNIYYNAFVKAGTPFIIDLKGDVAVLDGGQIKIGINTATACNFYACCTGIEVTVGA